MTDGHRELPAPSGHGPSYCYPRVPLPVLVAEQAARTPDAVAVAQGAERLTYRQLLALAGAVAERLRGYGVGPEIPVAVCARRRPPVLGAVLGVLASGGVYLPVDTEQPRQRALAALDDAGVQVVLADRAGADWLADGDGAEWLAGASGRQLVVIPDRADDPSATETVPPPCPARLDNAAYALFTSGSTGRPKGVLVSHRSLVAFVTAAVAEAGPRAFERGLAFASFGFDVSILDLFAPLLAGGTVHLVNEADRVDPARLQRLLAEQRITMASLPPVLLPLLEPAKLPELALVMTGTEPPGPEQVERWTGATADGSPRRLLNRYGVTEATVDSTSFDATGRWTRPLPIGSPLPNTDVYIVDSQGNRVPPGQPGELLIGGTGLARGYLGRPAQTAAAFVPDPFGGTKGGRLYRTGDLVGWGRDGALEFLGRIDRQIKIHGQRIEVGEVEAVLRGHPRVGNALVLPVPEAGGTGLLAVVVPAVPDQPGPDEGELRAYCADRVPASMVPGRMLRLAGFPRTGSDKIDIARLLELAAASTGRRVAAVRAAEDPLTIAVSRVWCAVLGIEVAGLDDDFFDVGGHSVAAMRLAAGLRTELGREVAVEDVFAGRTLAGVAARVAAAPLLSPDTADLATGAEPALSPAQQRLWFLDQLAPDSVAYNVPMAHRLRGPLDVAALADALTAVANRQQVLRWRIVPGADEPRAVVDPPGPVPLPVDDLSTLAPAERSEALAAALSEEGGTPFDLASGPLWRARLIRLAPDDHVLAITAHHAVFDGWSTQPLYADLSRAYGGDPLPPPAASYADYVAWRSDRARDRAADDLSWWIEHLAGVPTVLELPADHPRPPVQTYRGESTIAVVDEATTVAVGKVAATVGATPTAVLLAAFAHLLHRVSGVDDLVLGTPVADRRHAAFEDLIGFFVEIVPLRLRPDPAATFEAAARAARDELLDTLAHPEAPIERLVDAIGVRRDATRNPLVQVLFNVYNFPQPPPRFAGLTATALPDRPPGSPFDLTVYIAEPDGQLSVELLYNPDLFAAERIKALLTAYLHLLGELVAHPDRPAVAATLPAALVDAITAAGAVRAAEPAPSPPGIEPLVPVVTGPLSPTEQVIADVWREVLGLPAVRATDNFFDVGGHSMAMVKVRDRLARRLGRQVPVAELFRYPNVRALAAHLDGSAAADNLAQVVARGAARRQRARRSAARHRPLPPASEG